MVLYQIKKCCCFLLFLFPVLGWTQYGIGTNQPNPNTVLDLGEGSKGFLLPRVNLSDLTQFTLAATATASDTGIWVYNTNTTTGPGSFSWNGTRWLKDHVNQDVSNELIFIDDDNGYAYTSMMVNGQWRVIRFNIDDINAEDVINQGDANDGGLTNQPATLIDVRDNLSWL